MENEFNPSLAFQDSVPVSPVAQNAEVDVISLDPGASPAVRPLPDVLESRTYKAVTGLKNFNRTHAEIRSDLESGREINLRESAAANADVRKRIEAQRFITRIANENNQTLSEEQAQELTKLFNTAIESTDPNSVIEEYFAQAQVAELDSLDERESTFLSDAKKWFPEETAKYFEVGRQLAAKGEFSRTQLDNMRSAMSEQSWLGFGADFLKQLVPGYSEVKLRGNIEGVPAIPFGSGILLGNNLQEQITTLYRMPFPQFKTTLTNALEELKKDNPQMAVQFAAAVVSMSNSEKVFNNFTTMVDAVSLPGLGLLSRGVRSGASAASEAAANTTRAALRKSGLLKDLEGAVVDVAKAGDTTPSKASIMEAIGDTKLSATNAVTDRVVNSFAGIKPLLDPVAIAKRDLPDIMKTSIDDINANPGNFSRELITRLEDAANTASANLMTAIENVMKVERLPLLGATQKAVQLLEESIRASYPGMRNSILNISQVHRDPISNTHFNYIRFGQNKGTLFRHKQVAENWAKVQGLQEYAIGRKGAGFYVEVIKPLDETQDAVRDMMVNTKYTQTPEGILPEFIKSMVTPEETLSQANRDARKTSTYSPSVIREIIAAETGPIKKIMTGTLGSSKNKKMWAEWQRIVDMGPDLRDPKTGELGYTMRSPQEIEDMYQNYLKRMPTEAEVEAYFAFARVNQMDYMLRELALHKNKLRLGVQEKTISMKDATGGLKYSDPIEGVELSGVPGGEATIFVNSRKAGGEKIIDTRKVSDTQRKEWNELIKQGRMKVFEIYDPELRPLQGYSSVVGDARVRYVITETVDTKSLSWNKLGRRGGGHVEYDAPFYGKQANIRTERVGDTVRNWYEGDSTVMAFANRALGAQIMKHMDEVRKLLRRNRLEEAKNYSNQHLPMDWDEVYGWFTPSTKDGVKVPARFSLNEPFQVVPKNRLIGDMDKSLESRYNYYTPAGELRTSFVDGTRKGSLARQHQVQYTGERDAYQLHTIVDRGTKDAPAYSYEPAPRVDALTTMNRAMSRMINSTFMDDYKITSVEHWMREAAPYLKAGEDELRSAPFYHFHQPEWKPGADVNRVADLNTARMHIQQFLGMQNKTDTFLHSAAVKLADSIYTNFGPTKLDPSWMIPKLTDPFRFIRAVTFHAKLGVFALHQFIVQNQTYAVIYGVAGHKFATPGSFGALLTQYSRLNANPKILDHLDGLASKMNMPGVARWRPGEFKESIETMRRVGFGNIGGEYAMMDDAFSHKVISGNFNKFLDAGAFFFREGERNVRYGAWHTAFREFREANPTGRLTEANIRSIVNRADDLQVNMTRASSSRLHTGAMSIPSQFLSYQLRAMELFFGKRLTTREKARMAAYTAGIYGAPTALALTGLPIGDYIKKYAVENGYVVGDNFLKSLTMEGIPAMLMAIVSGGGDYQKGTFYNFSERYGVQGFEPLRDALRGDTPWWTLLGGAAFSTLAETFAATDGFTKAMLSAIRDDDEVFPFSQEDVWDVFKEISSVNSAHRLITAFNTSQWISKKGTFLHETSPLNAIFMTATGLQLEDTAKSGLISWSSKNKAEVEKKAEDMFLKEFRRAIRVQKDDPKQFEQFMRRAFYSLRVGGYPEHKYGEAIAKASRGYESQISQMNFNFYINNVPDNQRDVRQGAYQRRLQLNKE